MENKKNGKKGIEGQIIKKKQVEIRDKHPFFIWESITKNPRILAECLDQDVVNQVNRVAEKIIQKNIEHLFLLGTAAGHFASIAEKFAFEKIVEIPTSAFQTSEFKTYPPMNINSNTAAFFHSHSGGTKGDPAVVKMIRDAGGYTVGITDIQESVLAKCVDDVIIGPGGPKPEMPATRTYTSAIFRMLQLAITLGKIKNGGERIQKYQAELSQIPEIVEKITIKDISKLQNFTTVCKECSSLFVIGSGPNYATADESAIGFSQSMGIPAQSFQLENFLHGPIQTLRSNMVVIFIAAPGPLQDRTLLAAKACKIIGSKVILLIPENLKLTDEYDLIIRIPSTVTELFSPVVYIAPLWQLAYQFSLLGKGCHPDYLSMKSPNFKEALALLK